MCCDFVKLREIIEGYILKNDNYVAVNSMLLVNTCISGISYMLEISSQSLLSDLSIGDMNA